MKNLLDYIYEANNNDVYVIYLEDGTMYNYYENEEDAKKEAASLNDESKCNKATIKKEPRKNFEK